MSLDDVLAKLEHEPDSTALLFSKAKLLAQLGRDDEAKNAFLAVLAREPSHFAALTELGGLALSTGYRSAALTAYREAATRHPGNPFGLVNYANALFESGEIAEASKFFERALAIDPALAYAHQGLANVLSKEGREEEAEKHRDIGFSGHSIVQRRFRGTGKPLRVLLTVSVKGGVPTESILDDHIFAVAAVYAEYFNPSESLPEHDVVFNAVGDVDLCGNALDKVELIESRSKAPVVNRASFVHKTGRLANAHRLSDLSDIVVPKMIMLSRESLLGATTANRLRDAGFEFPLLLRAPGYQTGEHFVRVEEADRLADAVRGFPGKDVLAIEYLDARGGDGMARKYRVMFIDGKLYPLHLAVSPDWKVHYFSSAMAEGAGFRAEEAQFLDNMNGVLGARTIRTLEQVRDTLQLDYGGIDFGFARNGRLLFFEANATMAIIPPGPEQIWDHRREPISRAIEAARSMLFDRAGILRNAQE